MKTPTGLRVAHQALPTGIGLTAAAQIDLAALGKVVFIHKIGASVIRRVNINHLHPSAIGLAQQLQHTQVVALQIQVAGVGLVHSFTRRWVQPGFGGAGGLAAGGAFARPKQAKVFIVRLACRIAGLILKLPRQHLTQGLPIQLAIGYGFGQ